MNRRQFLATAGSTVAFGATTGCLGVSGSSSSGNLGDVTVPVPVFGNPDASVTVAAYEDFACPHCRRYTRNVLPSIAETYVESERIRYEYHDFPIPVSKWSNRVAALARAIQDEKGDDAHWTFTKQAFDNQSDYSWATLRELAGTHGIARDEVESLATARRYERIVDRDRRLGEQRGVDATPTVFVNGQKIERWTFENIAQAIENAR